MIPIYLGLLLSALAACGVALAGALRIPEALTPERAALVQRHQLLGLLSAVLLLVVQCAVFVYFLGTGKAIKVAVEQRELDPALARKTRRLKGTTFPFATFAAVAVVVGSVLGGAASPSSHAVAMGIALALTLAAAPFELRSLRANRRLMDETSDALALAERRLDVPGSPTDDPDSAPPAYVLGRLLVLVAVSAWLVFAYRTIVMRAALDPWPWYLATSVACALLGVPLLLRYRRR
jgi:hypothetical protein